MAHDSVCRISEGTSLATVPAVLCGQPFALLDDYVRHLPDLLLEVLLLPCLGEARFAAQSLRLEELPQLRVAPILERLLLGAERRGVEVLVREREVMLEVVPTRKAPWKAPAWTPRRPQAGISRSMSLDSKVSGGKYGVPLRIWVRGAGLARARAGPGTWPITFRKG